MAQRVKGQEVRVTVTGPEGVETALSDVVSFEATFSREILYEDLLGETAQRADDIFRHVEGTMEIQIESQDVFSFIQRVNDRSQRRTPSSERFNIVATLSLPNGETPRVLFEDVFFGEIQLSAGGREEYVTQSIPFGCSSGRFLGL